MPTKKTISDIGEDQIATLVEDAETDLPEPNNCIPAGQDVRVVSNDGGTVVIVNWEGQPFAIDASVEVA